MTTYIYVFCQETIITIVGTIITIITIVYIHEMARLDVIIPRKETREMRRVNYCNVFNTRSGRGERKMSVTLN